MTVKVEHNNAPFQINCKRFHMPGIKITSTCPTCGSPVERNFEDEYLSYPTANGKEIVHLVCMNEECEDYWEGKPITISLNVNVEIID